MSDHRPPLRCPVCSEPLQWESQASKTIRCALNHTFDQAKQGYWNLLLPQRKRSKSPGDNQAMVDARHQFLSLGHYQPIVNAIQNTLTNLYSHLDTPSLIDLGCGEGYYTRQIYQAMPSDSKPVTCIGLDISKPAILHASKLDKQITWLVATGADIPVMASSIDIATLIFARLLPEPTAKILKPGGYFLVVWPGPDHLRELRELIYTEVRDSDLNPDAQLSDLFEPIQCDRLGFRFTLNDEHDINHLLMMTPHGQRLHATARSRLLSQSQLTLQADIRLSLYRKR